VTRQGNAYLYATVVVLIWSTVASAFKISLSYIEPIHLLFYASIVSIIALFSIILFQNKIALLRRYSTGDLAKSALLGFLNPFLYYVVLFRAYSLLPAQQAVSLNYTWAIQLVILSIPLLRQKIGIRSVIAIIVGYLGVLIIATQGDFTSLHIVNAEGTLLALGSAVIWALFWIYNIKDKRDAVIKLFLNFLFGFVFVFVYIILSDRFVIPDLAGLAGAIYVGLFEMGITFVLWLQALRLSKTTAQVSNLIYLTPFLSLFIINIVVGERILVSTVIGLIFIIAGIILQRYPLQRNLTDRL
jgi:drug/metabolite transporter (DMT)-like permease